MRQVTEQDLLDITYDEYKSLGYYDSNMVDRVWEEAGRIKALPYDENCDLPQVYGDIEDRFSEEGYAAFNAWLKKEGASYYAAPREDFFIFKAVAKCLKEGNTLVYVEDLS